jgi:hypothetical protein
MLDEMNTCLCWGKYEAIHKFSEGSEILGKEEETQV